MLLYKTIADEGIFENIIEKSRFIGYARPVSSREEAEAFIDEIRRAHKDATHNVPAMILGDKSQVQWASDDGEPQGTAGAPIVQMLVMENITNVAVVVTRYFGGIKLGTGGLVRAYTNTAKAALEAGKICQVMEMSLITAQIDYSFLNKLKNISAGSGGGTPRFEVKDAVYAEQVSVTVMCATEDVSSLKELLMNLTGGSAVIISQESVPVKVPVGTR